MARDMRLKDSAWGRPAVTFSRPVNAGPNTRPADIGLPTNYTHCLALTKAEVPCKAANVKGERYCVGHKKAHAAAK